MLFGIVIVVLLVLFGPKLLAALTRTLITEAKNRTTKAINDARDGFSTNLTMSQIVDETKVRANNVRSLTEKRETKAS